MDYHTLGVALGRAKGRLSATAPTPHDAAGYERAALSIIYAVVEGLGLDDAGAYYTTRAELVKGINDGHAAALIEAAAEYGHEAARA